MTACGPDMRRLLTGAVADDIAHTAMKLDGVLKGDGALTEGDNGPVQLHCLHEGMTMCGKVPSEFKTASSSAETVSAPEASSPASEACSIAGRTARARSSGERDAVGSS